MSYLGQYNTWYTTIQQKWQTKKYFNEINYAKKMTMKGLNDIGL